MAQKQYGVIPQDTSLVGYGQDEPVVDHEAAMKRDMVEKIKRERERRKKKKKPGFASVGEGIKTDAEKRQEALDEAAGDKP
jgi:hypothetical protein